MDAGAWKCHGRAPWCTRCCLCVAKRSVPVAAGTLMQTGWCECRFKRLVAVCADPHVLQLQVGVNIHLQKGGSINMSVPVQHEDDNLKQWLEFSPLTKLAARSIIRYARVTLSRAVCTGLIRCSFRPLRFLQRARG